MISNQVAVGSIPNPSHRDAPGAEHPPSHHWGKSPLPATLLLTLIPLVLFGGPAAVSRPVPVKPVATESIRVIRMDATSFRGRWMPINDMPPATVIHEVQLKGGDALISQEFTGKPVEAVARPRPPAVRIVKRAALRQDICSRHGMHRVTVMRGKWQGWRCR